MHGFQTLQAIGAHKPSAIQGSTMSRLEQKEEWQELQSHHQHIMSQLMNEEYKHSLSSNMKTNPEKLMRRVENDQLRRVENGGVRLMQAGMWLQRYLSALSACLHQMNNYLDENVI